jgi:hypothetical protein
VGWFKGGGGGTEIAVLDIPAWFPLGFHDVVALLGEVLDKHLLLRNQYAGWQVSFFRVWDLTVARVITKAALLEHMLTSLSRAMIFFTRDTVGVRN